MTDRPGDDVRPVGGKNPKFFFQVVPQSSQFGFQSNHQANSNQVIHHVLRTSHREEESDVSDLTSINLLICMTRLNMCLCVCVCVVSQQGS